MPQGREGSREDIIASRKLLSYLQVFYTASILRDAMAAKRMLTPGRAAFVRDFNDLYLETGSYIGVARTLEHAERLVRQQMKKLNEQYPWLRSLVRKQKERILPRGNQADFYQDVLLNSA